MSRCGAAEEAGPGEEVNMAVPWTRVAAAAIKMVDLQAI